MAALIDVILPVFLVIGAGYLAARRGWLGEAAVDGLMAFAQTWAIPCLLFLAVARLDLAADFDLALIGVFYAGALCGFAAGLLGARFLFARAWEESVAVGMSCLYSNALLIGLPITLRAYGEGAIGANVAIIALHAPVCYLVGIGAMEWVRGRGRGMGATLAGVVRTLGTNVLVLALAAGAAVNLSGLPLPAVVAQTAGMLGAAAIPAALFGLGGVLVRYRPAGDGRLIAWAVAVSLLLHPAVVWALGTAAALTEAQFRSAVLTAASAPGVNSFLFASLYGVGRRVAASAVLIGTAACVPTLWVWLSILP